MLAATRRALVVTADHGNADEMLTRDKAGNVVLDHAGIPIPRTSHTLAPVPFLVCDARGRRTLRNDADGSSIATVGTTVLELLGVPAPDDYLPGLVQR